MKMTSYGATKASPTGSDSFEKLNISGSTEEKPNDDEFVSIEVFVMNDCVIKIIIALQSLDPTAQALQRCEKWILRPYGLVLKAVSGTVI